MTLYLSPYALALFFTAATTALVASMAWRQRGVPGSTALAWLMLAVTEWCLAAGMEAMAVEIPCKILWSQVLYVGVVSSPTLFMLFALEYTHQDQWLTRRNRLILWIMPALTLYMTATNGWHG